jgi:hypothetical protein
MASMLFSVAATEKRRAPYKKERHYMTVIMLHIQQTDGWLRKHVSFIRLQPVGLEESKRKSDGDWVSAKLGDFEGQ